VLRRHDLPRQAPEENEAWQEEADELPREDLTSLPFITIDGASTKDMDDALYVESHAEGWKLIVAIADPTAYVAPGAHWIWKPPNAPLPSTCLAAIFP